jgi:hypothetical protein
MTGSVFDVVLFANAPRCDIPGYRQWLEAFDGEEKWAGTWNREPRPGILPQAEMRLVVLHRLVMSSSGTASEAMRRFNEWQEKGHSESWLMLDERFEAHRRLYPHLVTQNASGQPRLAQGDKR